MPLKKLKIKSPKLSPYSSDCSPVTSRVSFNVFFLVKL